MKFIIFFLLHFSLHTLSAQLIHTIKADSVLMTNNTSLKTELNIENGTRATKAFLYNRGNGRTEFRKAYALNDSTIILGEDSIVIQGTPDNWLLSGNKGTNPAINFLGTKDNKSFLLKTNATERIRFTTGGNTIIGIPSVDVSAFKLQVAGNYSQAGNKLLVNQAALGGSDNLFQLTSNGVAFLKINSANFATCLGYNAGGSSITGMYNTALGYNVMRSPLSAAAYNSAYGVNTLRSIEDGTYNTAGGINAGLSITSGSYNVLMGGSAGLAHSSQYYNTFIGFNANTGAIADGPVAGPQGGGDIALGFNAGGSGRPMAEWLAAAPFTQGNSIMIGNRNGAYSIISGGFGGNNIIIGHGIRSDVYAVVLGTASQNVILTNSTVVATDDGVKLQIDGATGHQSLQLKQPYTPSATWDTNGSVGAVTWDNNRYMYLKTAAGWKRLAFSTF